MQRLIWIGILLTSIVLPSQGPIREVFSQDVVVSGDGLPRLDKGYLIQFTAFLGSKLKVYKPDGSLAFETTVTVTQGASVSLMNAAVDTDSTVAVSERHQAGNTLRQGVVILDGSGNQTGYFDTGQYVPDNLCWAPDHSLWSFGWQGQLASDNPAEYTMLRKYSNAGEPLGAYLPRSLYPKGLSPGGGSKGITRIFMSQNRVGLLAFSGESSKNREWVELRRRHHRGPWVRV